MGGLGHHDDHGATPAAEAPRAVDGDEVVLVVEDDPQVLRAVVRMLRRAGYRVLSTSDREEASRLAEAHGEEIDVVLSDVVMPGGSGPELVARLAPSLPRARVVYMSGYTDGSLRQREIVDAEAFVLEKPFTGDELKRAVRDALSR